jgi:hypothetical protein
MRYLVIADVVIDHHGPSGEQRTAHRPFLFADVVQTVLVHCLIIVADTDVCLSCIHYQKALLASSGGYYL